MKFTSIIFFLAATTLIGSCKKKGCTDEAATNYTEKAKKDDGSCVYEAAQLNIPSTYSFTDANGNSTVSYGGQTDRLNQLGEMTTYMKTGITSEISQFILNDMFENIGGNAAGTFSFTSTKQLRDKCFASDIALFESYFTLLATASESHAEFASIGQAGTLSSGGNTYLFSDRGIEYTQLIEKGLMGAVFMNQALNVYFESGKMDVGNTSAVDANGGKYYTEMEHHWDEAFRYFGAPIDFPSNTTDLRFWAKYCDKQNGNLGSNALLMNAFLKGRAIISQGFDLSQRDAEILIIRKNWEKICASQAVTYLEGAKDNFGTDNAKFLHELSEAYAFIQCLTYVPLETRVITYTEIETLLDITIGDHFWAVSLIDLNNAINNLNSIYSF